MSSMVPEAVYRGVIMEKTVQGGKIRFRNHSFREREGERREPHDSRLSRSIGSHIFVEVVELPVISLVHSFSATERIYL
jgi:hypothetical protein